MSVTLYETRVYKIKGITPTILHNGRLANPLDPYVQAIRKFSGKQKKTEEDHAAMADLEWEGSLYTDPSLAGPDEQNGEAVVCWPGGNIKSMLVAAGKKRKFGKKFQESVLIVGRFPLNYGGSDDWRELASDPNFRISALVKVGQARIMRTRPIFHDWGLTFEMQFLPDEVDEQDIDDSLVTGGRLIGLSDWRPEYGRFDVVEINGRKI